MNERGWEPPPPVSRNKLQGHMVYLGVAQLFVLTDSAPQALAGVRACLLLIANLRYAGGCLCPEG